ISIRSGETEPLIDAQAVASELGDLADVWVLPTNSLSWGLSKTLPDKTQVYGGAGRAYPVDPSWQDNPYDSPLRFAMDAEQGKSATKHLISDAMTMAVRAGLLKTSVTTKEAPTVSGTVRGLAGEQRVLVQLDDGALATIWPDLTLPEVPAENLLKSGQRVTGRLDPGERRLDVRASLVPPETALKNYGPGDVILVRVHQVSVNTVRVVAFPGLKDVAIGALAVTGGDVEVADLRDLFSPGEVVKARVIGIDPLALRMDDVERDDRHVPAPAVLPGGPPWIELPQLVKRTTALPSDASGRAHAAVGVSDAGTPAGNGGAAGPAAAFPGAPNPLDVYGALAAKKKGVPYKPNVRPAAPPAVPEPPAEAAPDAVAEAYARGFRDGLAGSPAAGPAEDAAGLAAAGEPALPDVPPEEGTASDTGNKPAPSPLLVARAHRGGQARTAPPAPAMPDSEEALRNELLALRQAERGARVTAEKWQGRLEKAGDDLAAARLERDQFQATAREAAEEVNQLNHQVADLRTKLRETQGDVRAARREAQAAAGKATNLEDALADKFLEADQQLRFEIYVCWAIRVLPQEKADYPLPDYRIGPEFVASLNRLQGVDRGKVVDVIVEVLTGRVVEKASSRRLHRLRESSGGGTPGRTRADGAVAMRVAIQHGTPGARQLHYWQLPNGGIELIKVGVHDEDLL
ncbi:MAG: hypothetical protein LBM66_03535, partial [Bifidobacteriaceae bacterium]|nr:hypothetical protein [Bifidobacteriaceae bacterium]